MTITEEAPAAPRSPLPSPGRARRTSPWWWLVAVCSAVLAVTGAVVVVWWVTSSERREVGYDVRGPLSALELDLADAGVVIEGRSGGPVHVQRTEEYAFGRRPQLTRDIEGDQLRIASRCPETVVGTCRVSYRISVRDNVQVNVRTSSGTVRITGLSGSARIETRSGAIAVAGFCGFRLSAVSGSGDVSGAADCSPDRLELRSGSGDVHAVVPANRYRLDANSDRGSTEVADSLTVTDDAPFAVQAISGSGDVTVERRG